MYAARLTADQRKLIDGRLQPAAAYLYDLSRRMQRVAWHPDDPAYKAAWRAHEALVELLMALNSAGTGHGWGPPTADPIPPIAPPAKALGEGKKGKLRNTFGNRAAQVPERPPVEDR